jgi:ribose transport system permease protein
MMTLTAVMAGIILTNLGMPLPIGILGAIASGAVMGAISGATIAKLKIPPFIATLGMMQIARGLRWSSPVRSRSTSTTRRTMPPVARKHDLEADPGLEIPNGVMIMFIVAIIASIV